MQNLDASRRSAALRSVAPARPPVLRAFLDDGAMVVDSFAGGGGASSGVARALRSLGVDRDPDVAINHDAEAIAMHRANHPTTRHYIEDVWQVDPREACSDGAGGVRPVGLMWLSPTCTHFSKAKGTALDASSVKLRGLAWVGVRWAAAVRPRVLCLENVEEFQKWGPLHRRHSSGCSAKHAAKLVRNHRTGKTAPRGCRKKCTYCKPIKSREGSLFQAFVSRLRKLGYVVEWRLLRACDYGAPTTRRRLFLVARCDGRAIQWPAPTHGPGLVPFRTAAECMDWSTPCPSIFERDRPLAEKTLARIARGIQKFVLDNPRPFIVPTNHGGVGRADHRVHSVDEPLRTITSHGRGSHAVAVPYLVHRSNGERRAVTNPDGSVSPAQAPRIYDVERPLGTIVAQGQKHALAVALLVKHNGGNNDLHGSSGQTIDRPIDTFATHNTKSLALAHLVKLRGTSPAHVASSACSVDAPLPTVTASGTHVAAVSAFLVRYNGRSVGQPSDAPIGTIDTTDRYSLVTVTLGGEEYVVVDIGMRMLSPRELFLAQGFSPEYVIQCDGPTGKPLTKTSQIRMVGNSVPPVMAEVIARAQLSSPSTHTFQTDCQDCAGAGCDACNDTGNVWEYGEAT